MSTFEGDSIFWIEVDKIVPNPFQPRKEFDEQKLRDLAESVRQYGILQPLTVTRKEIEREDGGISVEYELIAGERRLRAAKLAKLTQVPAIIRTPEQTHEENEQMKLELSIIENLQREDLNPVDRARAFKRLADEFGFSLAEVGRRMGKSREYVSNSVRILNLPEEIQQAIIEGVITDGHSRPLLMLSGQPQEQMTVFKEIVLKKLNVREAEHIARAIATDRARKPFTPEMRAIEKMLSDTLGTRVMIEQREKGDGGKLVIAYFSPDDLNAIVQTIQKIQRAEADIASGNVATVPVMETAGADAEPVAIETISESPEASDGDIYSIKNFSV